MKKGRHRRFEEARALKRGPDVDIEAILADDSEDADDVDLPGRSAWYEEADTLGEDTE